MAVSMDKNVMAMQINHIQKHSKPYSVANYIIDRQKCDDIPLRSRLLHRRLFNASNLHRKDLFGHFGCVNAIEFSNCGGQWLASGKCEALQCESF